MNDEALGQPGKPGGDAREQYPVARQRAVKVEDDIGQNQRIASGDIESQSVRRTARAVGSSASDVRP
jgi:hypothetical protein